MISSSSFFTDLLKVEDRSNTVPRGVLDAINYNMELLALTLQGKLTGSNIANGSIGDEAIENSDLWNAAYLDLHTFVETTYPVDQASLQDQIDGKIMCWFQDIDPNTWTEADRVKHNGDMWYSSSTKLLKRYNGILNSWELIEDQKAIDAYTAASTAQDTADRKRRVFTTRPDPPYDVGDLWAEGSTGDLKRCKTAKKSGSYSANDWELATKYDSPLSTTTYIIADYDTSNNIERADYVVPSGSTSAQEVINQAINDLPTDGGKLVLLDGTYVVDNSILVSSNGL